jgi:hypothetical protein
VQQHRLPCTIVRAASLSINSLMIIFLFVDDESFLWRSLPA